MSSSHPHSRKNFIAKLFGIGVSVGAVPALLASALKRPAAEAAASESTAKKTPFRLRADTRSIARRDETVI